MRKSHILIITTVAAAFTQIAPLSASASVGPKASSVPAAEAACVKAPAASTNPGAVPPSRGRSSATTPSTTPSRGRGASSTPPPSSGIQIAKGVFKITNGDSAVEVPVKFSKQRVLVTNFLIAEWKTGAMRLPSSPCAFLVTLRYKDGSTGTAILAPSEVKFPVAIAVLAAPQTPSVNVKVQAILSSAALNGLQIGAVLGIKK